MADTESPFGQALTEVEQALAALEHAQERPAIPAPVVERAATALQAVDALIQAGVDFVDDEYLRYAALEKRREALAAWAEAQQAEYEAWLANKPPHPLIAAHVKALEALRVLKRQMESGQHEQWALDNVVGELRSLEGFRDLDRLLGKVTLSDTDKLQITSLWDQMQAMGIDVVAWNEARQKEGKDQSS